MKNLVRRFVRLLNRAPNWMWVTAGILLWVALFTDTFVWHLPGWLFWSVFAAACLGLMAAYGPGAPSRPGEYRRVPSWVKDVADRRDDS